MRYASFIIFAGVAMTAAAGHASAEPAFPSIGRPLFGNPEFFVGNATREIRAADLDGDGVTDLAVARGGSYRVSVLLGNGLGGFSDPIDYTLPVAVVKPESIDIGDVDGDGDPDIVAVGVVNLFMDANSAGVLFNAGDGTFDLASSTPDSAGMEPLAIKLGLIDEDQFPDLVVINGFGGDLRLFLNDGTGHFPTVSSVPVGNSPRWLDVADLDGDGDEDAAVATTGQVRVLLNDGEGALSPAGFYGAGAEPNHIIARDLNQDAAPDLIVSNVSNGGVNVLMNNGDATFESGGPLLADRSALSSDVGDVNNDGVADLIVPFSLLEQEGVATLPGLGDGSFGEPTTYRTGSGPAFAVAAHLDDDGWRDLAVANDGPTSKSVTVLLSNGDGSYSDQLALAAGDNLRPFPIKAGDFDGDGMADIVASDFDVDTLLFWRGHGDGSFDEPLTFDGGGVSFGADGAVGDVDGDGDPDVIVLTSIGPAVFRNEGAGCFAFDAVYPAGELPSGVAVADLDGLAGPDLLVADAAANSLSLFIMLNSGDGTFGAPTVHQGGPAPFDVVAGDVDGDGDVDAILTAFPFLAVARNDGHAGFDTPELYEAGENPFKLVCDDFNDDASLDVAMSDPGFGASRADVHVFLNVGDGTFAPRSTYRAAIATAELVAADFDGDGAHDLATADLFVQDGVAVLLNDGAGAFGDAATYQVGDFTRAVIAADFDSDGAVDLGSASVLGGGFPFGEVSVLFNRRSACLGDLSGDDIVDVVDLLQLLAAWGTSGGDVDGDGDTDVADLLALLAAWGPCL
jgi:hypothetical protein